MSAEVVLLFLLVIKHSFADLFLQTFNKNIDKTKYLGNGQTHYLHHSVLTLLITLNFTSIPLAIAVALLDHIAHWHIDFWKSICVKMFRVNRSSGTFFRIQSLDQMLHFLTYFIIVAIIF
jgi:hypothetical protein